MFRLVTPHALLLVTSGDERFGRIRATNFVVKWQVLESQEWSGGYVLLGVRQVVVYHHRWARGNGPSFLFTYVGIVHLVVHFISTTGIRRTTLTTSYVVGDGDDRDGWGLNCDGVRVCAKISCRSPRYTTGND